MGLKLVTTACRRGCGKRLTTINQAMYALPEDFERYHGVCDDCLTPEEKEDMCGAMLQRIARNFSMPRAERMERKGKAWRQLCDATRDNPLACQRACGRVLEANEFYNYDGVCWDCLVYEEKLEQAERRPRGLRSAAKMLETFWADKQRDLLD